MALAQRACSGTALVLCAVLVGPVHAAKVSDAAATHEWMSTPVRTAAEQMLAAMPDDYYSIKGVAAEKAIATGVPTCSMYTNQTSLRLSIFRAPKTSRSAVS